MKTISEIKDTICLLSEISEEELTRKGRKGNTIHAKTLFCWFASCYTPNNSQTIAECVNLSMAAYWGTLRRYKIWYQYDKSFKIKANEIKDHLNQKPCSK